jgi:hypothetical protein
MSGSVLVTRSVSSSRKPRHALATGKPKRYDFPVTITDKSGRVRVVSGEVVRPKRGRKGRTSKNRKVAYRLSAQRVKGSADTFDTQVMREIGTIHQES